MKLKLLSLCIILAAGHQNAFSATTPSGIETACPENIGALSTEEKNALPKDCKTSGFTDEQLWITGGAIAGVAAIVGIAMAANGGGSDSGSDNTNNGGNKPDDGGNKPDDGGNKPDDGGNVPDDGGNVPDDGGNVPDDGGNVPDDGGNVPDDGGDSPDDGGDTPVPPAPTPVTTTYPNGLSVTMIPDATTATLTLNGESMQASRQSDGTWLITDASGKTYTAQTLDQTTGAITGYSIADRKLWTLDATTPTGLKRWTSTYAQLEGATTLESELTFRGEASMPLLIENNQIYTIKSMSNRNTGNIRGKIRIENNSAFLNSGVLELEIGQNGGPDRGTGTSMDYAADSIRLNNGVFINSSTGVVNYRTQNTIVALNNSTIINDGIINTIGMGGDGQTNLFLLGGDSADSTVNWVNTRNGIINGAFDPGYKTSRAGGNTILSDISSESLYTDNTVGGGNHYEGNINAVNNGDIRYTSASTVGTIYASDTLSTDAISLGNSIFTVNTFVNNGSITVTSLDATGAVALSGQNNTTLVNNGTINLGEKDYSIADNGTNLVAFKAVGNNVTAYNQGIVNINANDSYVFDRNGTTTAHLVNTGQVLIRDGVTRWGMVKGESESVVDTTSVYQNTVSDYTIGTLANGSAGQMAINHAVLQDVNIDTGFTTGSDAQVQSFDNVFSGSDIQGAENIRSTSVVWNANAQTDDQGNVDVTMTKNSYQEVVKEDAASQDMAAKLDANYTNNALYNSLNLKTSADVDKAMRQLSGANATTAFKEARVLSQRFNMLADNAIVMPSGFGFNLVDKNDKRSELGNDTRYDMMALSQSFALDSRQDMQLQYGIARLDGNGIDGQQKAGDNGLTGGYSQFFGLKYNVDFAGVTLSNALRYDAHKLESNRNIRYSGVNQTANSDNSQQYMEWRSQFSKGFDVAEGLNLTPSMGVKLRHTHNDAYSEGGAGDFNLNMNASDETAVDAIIGVNMKYAASNGWAMNALLEGGPNISYNQSAQSASLQGANNANFRVDSDQQGGGFNGIAKMGLSYGGKAGKLAFDAYQWKEDNIIDKGLSLGYQYNF